jgi:hypothetical protein
MTIGSLLFSAPMVRAILDGRKTSTRRIISPRNCEFGSIPAGKLTKLYWEHADWSKAWTDGFPDPQAGGRVTHGYLHVPCHDQTEDDDPDACDVCIELGWDTTAHRLYPRIHPGDLLWVREAIAPRYFDGGQHAYRADWTPAAAEVAKEPKWTPSIYMPRWASRITLKVTGVKIERLHDISEEDAIAEGIELVEDNFGNGPAYCDYALPRRYDTAEWFASPIRSYRSLWESIHDEGSWEANPWVVAVSFERLANPRPQP